MLAKTDPCEERAEARNRGAPTSERRIAVSAQSPVLIQRFGG
jgi:hypothetical protein